jgi:hypothetical protein
MCAALINIKFGHFQHWGSKPAPPKAEVRTTSADRIHLAALPRTAAEGQPLTHALQQKAYLRHGVVPSGPSHGIRIG